MTESLADNENSTVVQQQADPIVSRLKFDRELSAFKQIEGYNRERGVVLFDANFPVIQLAFFAYRIKPLILAFVVKLDFTNYNIEAPSLRFTDLITNRELTHPELNIQLMRFQAIQQDNGNQIFQPLQDLIQFHNPNLLPFVCLPGIREYHKHPAHSNDSWLTRRGKGEGTLGFIIDQLHKYGTEPLNGLLPAVANIHPTNPAGMLVQFQGIVFTRDKHPL